MSWKIARDKRKRKKTGENMIYCLNARRSSDFYFDFFAFRQIKKFNTLFKTFKNCENWNKSFQTFTHDVEFNKHQGRNEDIHDVLKHSEWFGSRLKASENEREWKCNTIFLFLPSVKRGEWKKKSFAQKAQTETQLRFKRPRGIMSFYTMLAYGWRR